METQDPPRWSAGQDDDVSELQVGLSEARASGPSAAQLVRMRTALAMRVAVNAPAAASHGRWLIKVLAGALLLVGGWLALQRAGAPSVGPGTAEASRQERAVQSASITEHGPEPAREVERKAELPPTAPRTRTRTRATTADVARALAPSADVAAELALLRPARAHVRSAPRRALELVAQHERTYPRGALLEEREVIAIEALLAQPERAAAEQRAQRFFVEHPRSAHARRIRALLATPSAAALD